MKQETIIRKFKVGSYTVTVIKHLCKSCNRYFRDLNLHNKTSRCGRLQNHTLTKSDMEMINKVGITKAIKANKK